MIPTPFFFSQFDINFSVCFVPDCSRQRFCLWILEDEVLVALFFAMLKAAVLHLARLLRYLLTPSI